MDSYILFDGDSTWFQLKSNLEVPFDSLEKFFHFVESNSAISEFCSIQQLPAAFTPQRLLAIFNYVRQTSIELHQYFPAGRVTRLNSSNTVNTFSRRQVLILLSHMFLCTFKKSSQNIYWVTFENWLTDGRSCAVAYLECLLNYFEQSKELEPTSDFWKETITFQRVQIDPISVLEQIEATTTAGSIYLPTPFDKGKIGDSSSIEMDFANKDIGFGTYGTQEEVMFGSSPELCIAMLFCDTMSDNESIQIKGARKVCNFDGYGSTLRFQQLCPVDDPVRNRRILIAADALDYSEYEDPEEIQFSLKHLKREVCKLVCAFSFLPSNVIVDTGKWGCGAFCGHKHLKALLQIIAAGVTGARLVFYTFGDYPFGCDLGDLHSLPNSDTLSVSAVWQYVVSCKTKAARDNLFAGLGLL